MASGTASEPPAPVGKEEAQNASVRTLRAGGRAGPPPPPPPQYMLRRALASPRVGARITRVRFSTKSNYLSHFLSQLTLPLTYTHHSLNPPPTHSLTHSLTAYQRASPQRPIPAVNYSGETDGGVRWCSLAIQWRCITRHPAGCGAGACIAFPISLPRLAPQGVPLRSSNQRKSRPCSPHASACKCATPGSVEGSAIHHAPYTIHQPKEQDHSTTAGDWKHRRRLCDHAYWGGVPRTSSAVALYMRNTKRRYLKKGRHRPTSFIDSSYP
jgi:hypothetical protein